MFCKTLAIIIFLFLICFTVFLYGIIVLIFKKIPFRNGGGGVKWLRVHMQWGVEASMLLHMMEGWGNSFVILVQIE